MPIDKELYERLLPSILFIKGLVMGKKENYENYLIEMINNSLFFYKKSLGIEYVKPLKEDDGEYDCISNNYSLDFKILASNSLCHVKSDFSIRAEVLENCTMLISSRKSGEKKVSVLHKVLRCYDFYSGIIPKEINEEIYINDIECYKKTILKKKNILFFYPYELFFKNDYNFNYALDKKIEAIENDFKNSFSYREDCLQDYDTYLTFIDNDFFVILEFKNKKFKIIDFVNVKKCPTYERMLFDYSF